jgi:hypothetical protein
MKAANASRTHYINTPMSSYSTARDHQLSSNRDVKTHLLHGLYCKNVLSTTNGHVTLYCYTVSIYHRYRCNYPLAPNGSSSLGIITLAAHSVTVVGLETADGHFIYAIWGAQTPENTKGFSVLSLHSAIGT